MACAHCTIPARASRAISRPLAPPRCADLRCPAPPWSSPRAARAGTEHPLRHPRLAQARLTRWKDWLRRCTRAYYRYSGETIEISINILQYIVYIQKKSQSRTFIRTLPGL
jgi:hypothetical protein